MTIKSGLHPLKLIFFIFLAIYSSSTAAAPSAAMGYTPKYPSNFKYFEYVNPNAPRGGKVALEAAGNFDSFNPFILKGIKAVGLGLVFDTLMVSSDDEPFSVYPLIANDIQLADDGLSVVFKIDKRARFINGDSILAEDVKFSFDTIMSDKAHPQFKFVYADVKEAIVEGKHRIRFTFKRQNPELHLMLSGMEVFSRKWLDGTSFDKLTEKPPLASGPYIIDSYDLGKRIVYKRNPDYWAKNLPVRKGQYNFDEIEFKYYLDQTIGLEAFKAGEFDFRSEYYSKLWAREHNGPNYDSGEIIKDNVRHSNNAGMQGFVFNTRRDIFKDPVLRYAISLAFDFEWSNKRLFYGQYVTNDSYFSNTELSSSGLPQEDELRLLEKYRDQLPEKVFTTEWKPVSTASPNSLRKNLRKARDLLSEAGYKVEEGVLLDPKGKVVKFDVLLQQNGFDRILAPFARNLSKLGITMEYRKVDRSLYIRRVRAFDYDMIVGSFPQKMSPGNELKNMFHSVAVNKKGSRNLMGIKDPVVDSLIDEIISAQSRKQLVVACRALDRVLLHGNYLVPNWYINTHRIAYWNKFERPEKLPLYFNAELWMLSTWWIKE